LWAYVCLFNKNFCYFRRFRPAVSFFSADLHVKLKTFYRY